MNTVSKFINNNFGSVRATDIKNQIWFVLDDICRVLNLKPKKVFLQLKADEKTTKVLQKGTYKREQLVNESGLWALVLLSKEPCADEFKTWLKREVIKSIKDNGYYIDKTTSEKAFEFKAVFDQVKLEKKLGISKEAGKSKDIAADKYGISRTQGTRLVRFTYLPKTLLNKLDEGDLTESSAENLSHLSAQNMSAVVYEMNNGGRIPDDKDSEKMKEMEKNRILNPSIVHDIMHGDRDETEDFLLKGTEVKSHIPEYIQKEDLEEFVIEAIDLYAKFNEVKNFEDFKEYAENLWNAKFGI